MTEEKRAVRLNDKDVQRMFATHLGGGVLQARLRQKGWTNERIAKECVRIIKEEAAVVSAWCEGENEKIDNPAWRLSVDYHTAVRILNEREGVHGDTLKGKEAIHEPIEERVEPVTSWYETEDEDFADILERDMRE